MLRRRLEFLHAGRETDAHGAQADHRRREVADPGEVDLYGLEDLPSLGGSAIEYVKVTAVAKVLSPCEDPTCWGKIKLRVNGYESSVKSVGEGSYTSEVHTWTTNPATGQAWTESEVNALQAGVKLDSTNWIVRVTQLSMTVSILADSSYSYDYDKLNQLTSLTRQGVTTTFAYDDNGNLLSKVTGGTTWSYEWNSANLLTKAELNGAQQQAYQYDGLGRRVKVDGTSGSTWTVSLFSGLDVVYEVDQAGAKTKYVRANGMLLAKVNPDASIDYYLSDHLGSTQQVLDASRNPVFSAEYEPFGKAYNVTGSEAFQYTGEKNDDPTGLVYLRARQYDPEIGRFVSADPLLGQLHWPQTLNRYAYVANNPLRYTDPTGEGINLLAAGIGAAIGAVAGYGICVWQTGGWTSTDCAIAAGAGAVAGGVAGLTFGVSLVFAGGTLGLGVPTAGGFAFSGLSGAAAFAFAGAVSGAAAGLSGYMAEGGLTHLLKGGFDWALGGALESMGWGTLGGLLGSLAGYGLARAASIISQRFAGRALGRLAGYIDDMFNLADFPSGHPVTRVLGGVLGATSFRQGLGQLAAELVRGTDRQAVADFIERFVRVTPLSPSASAFITGNAGQGVVWYG